MHWVIEIKRAGIVCAAAIVGGALMLASAQAAVAKEFSTEEQRALYDRLGAKPGWPAVASEQEVARALGARQVKPEDRAAIIALMKQDVCAIPDMKPVCRYYGADTIHKLQKLSWGDLSAQSNEPLDTQLAVLEYGVSQNLGQIYGERGLSDARERELNNTGASRKLGRVESKLSAWLNCAEDVRTLSSTGWFWQNYKLTTCGVGLGYRIAVAIFGLHFSAEADLLLTNSRFARKVLFLWWQTGAEPSICSQSQLHGSGSWACNSYSWTSPISVNAGAYINQPPVSVISLGKASRLNQPFSASITFQ